MNPVYRIAIIGPILATLVMVTYPLATRAQSAQQVARRAFQATVLLIMEDGNGQPLSLGSGFFVLDGQLATNVHVIKGASRGYAKLVGQSTRYDVEGVAAIDAARDLVLLKVRPSGVPTLPLGDSGAVEVGETVFAVGNPQGLEGTFSQGIVSGFREASGTKILQITAPISPGSSGGPILNSRGQVIGVSVATFKDGQNLNFAIPSVYLRELMAKIGTPRRLEGVRPGESAKSSLGDLGGPNTEAVVGGQLMWRYGSCPDCVGEYSFSLRNQLRNPIRNVTCQVIFYDTEGLPIEVDVVHYRDIIPAGLARRVTASVESSVKILSSGFRFRILDFQFAE